MGKKGNAAARRAKKKHEKNKKRAEQAANRRWTPTAIMQLAARIVHDPFRRWQPAHEGVDGLARRILVSGFEAAYMGDTVQPGIRLPHEVWTVQRMRKLTTGDILRRLSCFGIETSAEMLRAWVGEEWDTWKLAEDQWATRLPKGASVHHRDFVRIAACELRARWMPDPPFHEQVLELYMDGWRAYERDEHGAALERWLAFWRRLEPRLTDAIRTTNDVQRLLGSYDLFFNWAEDFAWCVIGADVDDPVLALAGEAAGVLRQMLDRLPDQGGNWRLSVIDDLSSLLYLAGKREEAEDLLRSLIEEYPGKSIGYVTLAEQWASGPHVTAESVRRALALLWKAASFPVTDGDDWELAARITDLGRRLHLLEEAETAAESHSP